MTIESAQDRAAMLDFGKPFPSLMLPVASGTLDKPARFHLLHMIFARVDVISKAWGLDRITMQNNEIMTIIRAIAPTAFKRFKL